VDQNTAELGLRERKKQETRLRIQGKALELFAARGFDRVSVAVVAWAANVSQATVFNYFPTKEDLVFDGMVEYGRQLLVTLRDRESGTSLLEAFRRQLLQPRGVLADADPAAIEGLLRVRRIIAGSVVLRGRELLIADASVGQLAELVAGGPPVSVSPWFLATAMVGISQAMTREIHRLAAEGLTGPEIAAIVLPQGVGAIDVLERGLAATGAELGS
jgi:AcrR family transcriptional regulator